MLLIKTGNPYLNYLSTFLFGGLFVTLIYFIVTYLKNPVLAAIVGFFPLGLLCCFVMPTKNELKKYLHNGLYVCLLTLTVLFIGYLLLTNFEIDSLLILISIVILWFIFQYLYYISCKKY